MGARRLLLVAGVAAGCGQLFGFDDPLPRPDSSHSSQCESEELSCAGTKMAVTCQGCWVTCTEKVTRAVAKSRCASWGGGLAALVDSEVAGCLRSQVFPAGDVWIGLEQASGATAPGSGWGWNGSSAMPQFVNWGSNQPDDNNGGNEIGSAQCVRVPDGGSTWDDATCGDLYAFACTRDSGN